MAMENPRTETARDNDDKDLIENADTAPSFSAGGVGLAADVGTEQDLTEVGEPDARTRVRKNHDQHHDQAFRTGQPSGID
jgi:hypothetical protein